MAKSIDKVLVIDAGNTRIKSAALINGQLLRLPPIAHVSKSASKLCKQLIQQQQATEIYVSSVLAVEFMHSVTEYCHSLQIKVVFIESTAQAYGLTNAYQQPERLGVDRFVAMLGALDLGLSAELIIVVDAGTAVTIDLLRNDGKHLGGIISPGLGVMFASLHKKTQLDQQSVIDFEQLRGRYYANNTDDAMVLGTVNTFIAGIKYTVEQAVAQCTDNVSIILTGGDAGLIAEALALKAQVHPDLILVGLQQVYNHEHNIV